MTEVYPAEGPHACARLAQMRMAMPFGDLRATLSNRLDAEAAAVRVEGRPLPELVYAMFVPLSERITSVNEAYELRVKVSLRNTLQTLDLPAAGYQAVQVLDKSERGPTRVLVTINLQAPLAATAEELADPAFREPSAMVDSSDPFLIELASKADVPAGASPVEVALALRELVYDHVLTKDLTTAFASASEVARTRAGDCTEHAVLLAALLRARKIPARVCHGLVYVERYKEETERDGASEASAALL